MCSLSQDLVRCICQDAATSSQFTLKGGLQNKINNNVPITFAV